MTGTLLGLLVLSLVASPLADEDEAGTGGTEASDDRAAARARPTTTRDTPTTERTTTTTQPEEPETLAMGETLSMVVTDFNGSDTYADVTVANPATFAEEPVEFGMTPQNGLFLVLDVTVVVGPESEGTYPVIESDFKFVAADGSVAETTFASGFEPMLQYTDLSAGQRASGKIVFDINPAQQTGARIQINDAGEDYGEPFAYWALG